MTKAGLIEKVTERMDSLTTKQTKVVVNMIFESIKSALARGEKVEIRGFGSFRVRNRRQRRGRNPKTGISVNVPAKRVPFFKTGKELREIVDKGEGISM